LERVPVIEQIADRIKRRGIRLITGDVIGDDSYFSGDLLGQGWEWDDAQFYYGSEVSALTVNDNVINLTVTPASRIDEPPAITMEPLTRYVQIVNNAKTVAYGQTRIGVHRPLNSNAVQFFGTIPRSAREFKIYIAIHDPAIFAATLLKEALERRKIRVRGKVRRIDAVARLENPFVESKLIEIAVVQSQPISEILKVINKQSQNLHTELMLRLLGTNHQEAGTLDDYGHPKSSAELGNDVRRQFLERIGVDTEVLSLRDGSGLARKNLVTPRSTTQLLEFMLTHPHFNNFYDSLVIAGKDGTMERRMRGSLAADNFRGKTGTLTYANALSGYLTTQKGQMLIISIMGNNYTGPGRDVTLIIDQICTMLAEYDGRLP
jgi:D-alanyl-D-alanine carboxypeptidase/D-alanyl-D-alanine-endopeptidase (penicillin-binding protein 4)